MYKKSIKKFMAFKSMVNISVDSGQIIQIVKEGSNQVYIIQPTINLWSSTLNYMVKHSILGFKWHKFNKLFRMFSNLFPFMEKEVSRKFKESTANLTQQFLKF